MTHNNIWKIFKEKIPFYADNAETWFPCGRGAIRVRMKTKRRVCILSFRRRKLEARNHKTLHEIDERR